MIKNILKKIVTAILRFEASLILKKYRPKIIGITGSVGKTGTKDAIAQVLGSHFRIRKSQKSFNHEIGIPLTILGLDNAWRSLSGWLKNILEGLSLILFSSEYPEWLVLEVGVEHPGDIARVISWIKFDMVALTHLPEVPVHVEFFAKPEDLIAEKLLLPRSVRESGTVIVNGDDPKIMALVAELKAEVLTYGFHTGVTIQGEHEHVSLAGLAFKVDYAGHHVPFHISGVFASHQLYGVLAAIGVGVTVGLNLIEIAEALATLETPPGRFRLLAGIKDSIIVDDSYNSSPAALEAALKTLDKIKTGSRRIAVLGDMMELGPLTVEAHRQAGVIAGANVDFLITVGMRSKFLAEAAEGKHLTRKKMLHFDTWQGVGEALRELIKSGDVILIKGSQSIRLEKVVEAIMAHPEDKAKLLVRQEKEWSRI